MENDEYAKKDLARGVDYIGVNCIFLCHDGKGNFLLHKRSKNCRDEKGRWDCGAGAMEFGESFEGTIRREVREEYCAKAVRIEYIGSKNVLREHDGKMTHWVGNLHLVEVNPAQVKIGDPRKMGEIGWFSLGRLPRPLHSQMGNDIKMLKEFLAKRL